MDARDLTFSDGGRIPTDSEESEKVAEIVEPSEPKSLDEFIRFTPPKEALRREPLPVKLPTVDGDYLYDSIATAEFLGITVSAVNQSQYRGGHSVPAPLGVTAEGELEAAVLLTRQPELRSALEELIWRAGGRGQPLRFWRLSDLRQHRARRKPHPRRSAQM